MSVPARADVTAFEGARLIVGNGSVVENGTLVIDGNKIVQAGQGVAVPAGATRVNLAGKTVMPAIIDTHVHLSANARATDPRSEAARLLGRQRRHEHGHRQSRTHADAQRGDSRRRALSQRRTRHHPQGADAPDVPDRDRGGGPQGGPRQAALNVQIIKIWVDDRDGKVQKVTPAQYAAIIDEAHKAGIRVTAHIFNMEDAKGLMRANLDAFAHGVRDKDVDDETVAMFKAAPEPRSQSEPAGRGVKVDRSWMQAGMAAEEFAKLEGENIDRPQVVKDFHGIQARNLAKMNAAGVRIVMGTDGNRPWGPHEEMEDMVLAGMTPAQVIVASTRNGAEFLQDRRRRHAGSRQERRLHRARRQSARRHQEHAKDFVGLSARRGGRPLASRNSRDSRTLRNEIRTVRQRAGQARRP